jgi:hypothetical protein
MMKQSQLTTAYNPQLPMQPPASQALPVAPVTNPLSLQSADSYQKQTATKTTPPAKRAEQTEPSISIRLALLGSTVLLGLGVIGTYFAGKHGKWFQAEAAAKTLEVKEEVIPKNVLEALELAENSTVEEVIEKITNFKRTQPPNQTKPNQTKPNQTKPTTHFFRN